MRELIEQYEVIHLHKFDEWKEPFFERYVSIYAKYDYILGDMSAGVLRLTGFYEANFDKDHKHHLNKMCAYDAPYFIIKNLNI